ncbi:acyltransferase family protein [Brevundimonas sp. PWP3-1b1]|uniref:acyltransferase family protein n=1 Tax=unclassified Brevundimonas TaxID=2622653 RepID=UPI003CF10A3D
MVRQGWADAARGLAIITIVFFHVVLGLGERGEVHWTAWMLINLFAPFPIVLFFVAAGRFSQTLLDGGWSAAVTRRIAGLCYVFALWTLLNAAAAATLGDRQTVEPLAYLANPRSPLWFIWALVLYTAIAAATPRSWRLAVIIGAGALSFCSFAGLIALNSFVYDNLLRFLPFFLTGVAAGEIERSIEGRRWRLLLGGGLLFAGLTALTVWMPVPLSGKGALLFGLAVLAAPVGIAGASIVAEAPWIGRLAQGFGRYSLGVYLVHPIMILIMFYVIDMTGQALAPEWIGTPFVLTIVSLGISIGFVLISQKLGLTWLYRPPAGRKSGERMAEARER